MSSGFSLSLSHRPINPQTLLTATPARDLSPSKSPPPSSPSALSIFSPLSLPSPPLSSAQETPTVQNLAQASSPPCAPWALHTAAPLSHQSCPHSLFLECSSKCCACTQLSLNAHLWKAVRSPSHLQQTGPPLTSHMKDVKTFSQLKKKSLF